MFIEERHQAILNWLQEKGSITVGDIQSQFGVGYDSAKRDLRIFLRLSLWKQMPVDFVAKG